MRRDAPEILDFRKQEELREPVRFLEYFDSLDEGVVLELRHRSDLDGLLAALQSQRADQFEWWPLEREDPLWRVLLVRHPPGQGPRTLTDLFATDHERMRGIFELILSHVRGGDRQAAAAAFSELRLGIDRHARGEEELLFPVFSASELAEAREEVRVFAQEHKEIRKQTREVCDLFAAEERFDQAEIEEAVQRLWRHVQVHEEREERVLLPLCDRLLPSDERKAKVTRAQRY